MNLLMIILIVASILAFALARPQYPDYKDIDDERFHDERYDDDGTGVVVDKVYATPRPNKHDEPTRASQALLAPLNPPPRLLIADDVAATVPGDTALAAFVSLHLRADELFRSGLTDRAPLSLARIVLHRTD
ncbi:unnamed protein product [Caenorhabditis auriculariae]|uniref:Uncharacterized protein n=1 Tax=Caenorhabditis auriculariae TaxID=2777116 RepID=A0A8S1HQU2_9PELO|nr:unnamed protein product [Caenorhabditis auriculariae]